MLYLFLSFSSIPPLAALDRYAKCALAHLILWINSETSTEFYFPPTAVERVSLAHLMRPK